MIFFRFYCLTRNNGLWSIAHSLDVFEWLVFDDDVLDVLDVVVVFNCLYFCFI